MTDVKEALMPGTRSDRARARAGHLLTMIYPSPRDADFDRLRELAFAYIQEAERLEADNGGRVDEPREMVSAALDAVARDYFSQALARGAPAKRR